MALLDGAAAKSFEFVDETTFGTMPTNPVMVGFGGYVNTVTINEAPIPDTFPYLKDAAGTNRLQSTEVVKVSEAHEVTIEMRPTDWTILPRILRGVNATTYAIGDTVYDISFGARVGTEYQKLTGGAFSKYECTIEEDKTVVSTITAPVAAVGGFTTTYVGAGSYAAAPSGDALKYDGLTSVTYDAAALSTHNAFLDMIKWGIEYPVNAVKAVDSTLASNIGAWAFGQRNTTLEMGLSLEAMDIATDMLGGSAHTFEYTLGGKTFSFSNIKWMGAWDGKLDPDDVLGMSLTATNVDLAIT